MFVGESLSGCPLMSGNIQNKHGAVRGSRFLICCGDIPITSTCGFHRLHMILLHVDWHLIYPFCSWLGCRLIITPCESIWSWGSTTAPLAQWAKTMLATLTKNTGSTLVTTMIYIYRCYSASIYTNPLKKVEPSIYIPYKSHISSIFDDQITATQLLYERFAFLRRPWSQWEPWELERRLPWEKPLEAMEYINIHGIITR